MTPECPGCPFKHWPVRCHASTTGHTRFCELIKTRADYLALLWSKTLSIKPADPRTAVTLASRRKAREVRNCLYASSCGCDGMPRSCSHPDTPLRPYQSDCLTCVVMVDKQRS